MSDVQTPAPDAIAAPAPVDEQRPGLIRRVWSRKPVRILLALVLVTCLAVVSLSVLTGTLNDQQAGHPRSSTRSGSAAIAQLLRDEGVHLEVVSTIDDAVAKSDDTTTLVVVRPVALTADNARTLQQARRARMVVVQPNQRALDVLDLKATASVPDGDTLSANCSDPIATRAASIRLRAPKSVYRPNKTTADDHGCFRSGAGYAYLQLPTSNGTTDLISGGLDNATLDQEGNAAFAMGLFGTQPKIIWLMTPDPEQTTSGRQGPGLLPDWWLMAVAQALVAVATLAVWRGRRLGPILSERLPVKVRASETVEGHGRLYERLKARDRAAAALRRRARARLAASLGHAEDPDALAQVVADRTGRDLGQVRFLLSGPEPTDDDQLIDLALHLDQLEQEARQP